MKIGKVIWLGLFLWLMIFAAWAIIITAPFVSGFGGWQWGILYLALIPMTVLVTRLYYFSGDKLNGFLLGVLFVVVVSILDLVITAPLFIEEGYVAYYSNYLLWISLAEIFILTGITGIVSG